MAKVVRCRACSATTPIDGVTGAINCRNCGKPIRLKSAAPAGSKPVVRRKSNAGPSPKKVMLIGGAAVLGVVLLIGLVLMLVPGGGKNNPNPAGPDGAGTVEGTLCKLDTPVEMPPEPPPPKSFPYTPAPLAKWDVKPDPAAGPDPWDELKEPVRLGYAAVIASGGGPFVLAMNDALYQAWQFGPAKFREAKIPPVPLIDVRTGKPAGGFASMAMTPAGQNRLSPGGTYLAGPDAKPDAPTSGLAIWKKDAAEPSGRVQLRDTAYWIDWADDQRLIVLEQGAKSRLTLYDPSGKLLAEAALPPEQFHVETLFTANKQPGLDVWAWGGAVSPGGKFLALGGLNGVAFFSLADLKPAGLAPISGRPAFKSYSGIAFSPDGRTAWATVIPSDDLKSRGGGEPRSTRRVVRVDLTDGTTDAFAVMDPAGFGGPPTPGPAAGTVYLPVGSNAVAYAGVGPTGMTDHRVDYEGGLFDLRTGLRVVEAGKQERTLRRTAGGKVLRFQIDKLPEGGTGWHLAAAADADLDVPKKFAEAFAAFEKTSPGHSVRPAADPLDRSAAKTRLAEEPAKWAVPSPGPALQAGPAGVGLPGRPQFVTAKQISRLVAVEQEVQGGPPTRTAWQRFDRQTAAPIGKPVDLLSGTRPDREGEVFAVRDDDQRIALRDPADAARIDLWDAEGKRLRGYTPFGSSGRIEACGFDGTGKLLVLGGRRLMAIDPDANKVRYDVEGGYDRRLMIEPGGTWAVLSTLGGRADVVELATGKILGRLDVANAAAMSLSPDGKRLAYSRRDGPNWQSADTVHVVAMADGSEQARLSAKSSGATLLGWAGTSRLILSAGYLQSRLFDVDRMVPLVDLKDQAAFDRAGGLWTGNNKNAAPDFEHARVEVPDPLAGGELAFGPGSKVRLEIDVGDAAASARVAKSLAQGLQAAGFAIGPGGWLLKATHAFGDSTAFLIDPTTGAEKVAIQEMKLTLTLTAPDGAAAWSNSLSRRFDVEGSKNVDRQATRGQDRIPGAFTGPVTVVNLGPNPKGAMRRELAETFSLPPVAPAGFPLAAVKAGGTLTPLPLAPK